MSSPSVSVPAISVREVWIETPRLILREHTASDAEAVHAYAADPEVLRYRMSSPATIEQVRENLGRIEAQRVEEPLRTRYELAIVTREEACLIGWLPLILSGMPDTNDAEIGWTLARSVWGRGFATEAARATLAFAFETLRLHRVWAYCQPENVASSRIMEKIGMRREGLFRQCRYIKEQWIDTLYYGMLEEEWWALRRESLAAPTRLKKEEN